MNAFNPGWYYDKDNDRMAYDPGHQYSNMTAVTRTQSIIGDIVHTIDKNIRVTFDCPEYNNNGRVPVLDVEMWMEGGLINHVFYRKPIASKYLIMNRSAMSSNVKRNTLFQEGLKRVAYTRGGGMIYNKPGKEGLDIQDVELRFSDMAIEKLNEFCNMMRVSGYDEAYRKDIIMGVHKRVLEMEILIHKGQKERYRNREQINYCHKISKGRYVDTWFLKGGNHTSVLNIQPTPGGKLAKMLRDGIGYHKAPDGGTTKIVEVGGEPISKGLFKADPFKGKGCPFPAKCAVNEKGGCNRQRVIYELKCLLCEGDEG